MKNYKYNRLWYIQQRNKIKKWIRYEIKYNCVYIRKNNNYLISIDKYNN